MNSLTGTQTFPEKPPRPRTWEINPSYTQVMQCKGQRLIQKGTKPQHNHRLQRPQNRRATFWSVTYDRKGPKVFTACVSWTLTQNIMWRRYQRGVFKMQQNRKDDVLGGLPPSTPKLFVFFVSVYGLMDFEADTTLKRIARRLATKCQQPYPRTCGYVNS